MKRIPKAVAAYYSEIKEPHRETLLEMRARILDVVPDAEEIMKYGMPTFVIDEIAFAGLLANKQHIGYYPYSGSVLNDFPEICEKYKTTKGALHIPIGKPMLKSEVKKLIKARLALL